MSNGKIALEGLLDFLERAESDYSVPDDMYELAKMYVDLIRRNDYDYGSWYYVNNFEDVYELKDDYLTNEQARALEFWMQGN